MYLEIEAAVRFFMKILSLKNILTADQLDSLGKNLACLLRERYRGHWYPDQPARGQAYRCIRINKWQYVDESLLQACKYCGLEYSRLPIPREITIWIDPFEVCGRIGETREYFTIAMFKPVYEEPLPVCQEPVLFSPEDPVVVCPEQVHEEQVEHVTEEPVLAGPEHVTEPVLASPEHEPVLAGPEHVTEEPVLAGPEHVTEEPVLAGPEHVTEEPVLAGPEHVTEEPVLAGPEHEPVEHVPAGPEHVTEEPVPAGPEHEPVEHVPAGPEHVTEEPVPAGPEHEPVEHVPAGPEQVNEEPVEHVLAGPEQVNEESVAVYLECETSDYSSDGLSSESEIVSENSSDEETEKAEAVVMPTTCTSPDEAVDSPSTSNAGTPVSELLVADQETDESVAQETT